MRTLATVIAFALGFLYGQRTVQSVPEKPRKAFRDHALTALITLIVVSIPLLLLRQGVVAIQDELSLFNSVPSAADQKFSKMKSEYQTALVNRRGITERMYSYIKDNEIVQFHENYEKYNLIIEEWNEKRGQIADQIIKFTKCETKNGKDIRSNQEERFKLSIKRRPKFERLTSFYKMKEALLIG